MILKISLCIIISLLLSCGGTPPSQGPIISAPTDANPGMMSTGTAGAGLPDWVRNPYNRYNSQEYLAAVGSGSTRLDAERNAVGSLISQFGQSIHVDERISTTYQEAVRSGVSVWSEVTSADTIIALSTSFDTLIGVEIGETWEGSGTHYAAAILNKPRAAVVYTDMVRANQAMITNLTSIPASERNTLNSFARLQFAAAIADVNVSYGNLLQQIGSPFPGLRNGDELRLEAAAIQRSIPINITVSGNPDADRAGRIRGAFTSALSELGFQSGGINSRYVLDLNISITPADIAGSTYVWSRINVSANLGDSVMRTVLLPYNFNIREGHTTRSEADNRVILAAERRVNDEYAVILGNYLSGLLP